MTETVQVFDMTAVNASLALSEAPSRVTRLDARAVGLPSGNDIDALIDSRTGAVLEDAPRNVRQFEGTVLESLGILRQVH